ncbi:fructuronate reductase [Microbacterium terrae]|uniref:mannitol dehydrogenase family protein n=1 Tax=Microbacterium terrae TaxID=69369 RepID=UPI0005ECC898|nr:mannitol dehydrogenase family protein [Microbacterium terrae]MBP1079497.1 fructuronate reductase [Microbacterium terrae]
MSLSRDELRRRGSESDPAPARIIHLGLGHFFRAHQAWYTAHAADADGWGIAAFTGRGPKLAAELTEQDCLFTLVERGAAADRLEVVTSVVEARSGSDVHRLVEMAADPAVAIVTLTVTENGYRLTAEGAPDLDDADVLADRDDLRSGGWGARTVLGRLLCILAARRAAEAGPIAIVSCDNIPRNGVFVERGVTAFARDIGAGLAEWVDRNVSFVSTSVDRITPHIPDAPQAVADAGWIDRSTVITEPFADWVLAGEFPAGRPAWETAGARFVDDIESWENRKLWLLNGAHTILAVAGLPRGLLTVAEAIADPTCRALVEDFWDEAVQCLPAGTEHVRYRDQLVERFSNPRIVHQLTQIAADTTVKVQFRFASVAERTVAAGRRAFCSARAFGAWIDWVVARPTSPDPRADDIAEAAASDDPVVALIRIVSPSLAASEPFVSEVRAARG